MFKIAHPWLTRDWVKVFASHSL